MTQQVPFALGVVLVVVCASPMAQAPAPAAPKPSFDVASVKPNKEPVRGSSLSTHPGGRFTASNQTLESIVRYAFGAHQPSLLVGLPDWAASERFDIVAKAEEEFPTPAVVRLMVQSLLEDRFKLVTHREMRNLPAYALVLARNDGKLGPQLKQSDVDCAALAAARRAGDPAQAAPVRGEHRPCMMTSWEATWRGTAIPMAMLVASLSSPAQRMVVDRTGLKGAFDFELTFSREQTVDTTGPSVFTAVQEQLGLKLEPIQLPTQVVVIDSVDRPSPD